MGQNNIMIAKNHFPEGSVLTEYRLDIYAGTQNGEISIFHEGTFHAALTGFEYDSALNALYFLFEGDDKRYLGAPLRQELIPYFMKEAVIGVFEVTKDKRFAQARELPLKQINAPGAERHSQKRRTHDSLSSLYNEGDER